MGGGGDKCIMHIHATMRYNNYSKAKAKQTSQLHPGRLFYIEEVPELKSMTLKKYTENENVNG